MKFITLFFALVALSTYSLNAQTKHQNWNLEQEKVLKKFGLSKSDHRGMILSSSSSSSLNSECKESININDAIERFLNSKIASDLTEFCIKNSEEDLEIFLNRPLDIYEITKLFTQLDTSKND